MNRIRRTGPGSKPGSSPRGQDGATTRENRAKDTASAEAIAAFVLADAAVHGAKRADPKEKGRTNKQRRRMLARLHELHSPDEVKLITDTAALRPLDLTALGKLGPIARGRVVDAMRDAIADILHAGVQSPRARRRIFDGYLLIGYGSARQDEPSDRDATTYSIDRGHAHIDRGHAIEAEERAAREQAKRLAAYGAALPSVRVHEDDDDDEDEDEDEDDGGEALPEETASESTAGRKARPAPTPCEDGRTSEADEGTRRHPRTADVESLGTPGLIRAATSPASPHAKTAAFLPPPLAAYAEHFADLDLHRLHDIARASAVRDRALWLARERGGRRVLDPSVIERIDKAPNGWRTTS